MSDSYHVTGGGRKPKLKCPPKACETHSHVYGPSACADVGEKVRNAILAGNPGKLYDFDD